MTPQFKPHQRHTWQRWTDINIRPAIFCTALSVQKRRRGGYGFNFYVPHQSSITAACRQATQAPHADSEAWGGAMAATRSSLYYDFSHYSDTATSVWLQASSGIRASRNFNSPYQALRASSIGLIAGTRPPSRYLPKVDSPLHTAGEVDAGKVRRYANPMVTMLLRSVAMVPADICYSGWAVHGSVNSSDHPGLR